MVGTEALGGEVEEEALGEVLFVFDEGDEGRWGWIGHVFVYGFIVVQESNPMVDCVEHGAPDWFG